ncbi:hypothetical protein FAES_3338 [Fibrella aestuarina BUZ 2]|uniref:Uncharacterized protein n=2 Tax=Fibrella TaxID=861914 RepID=I0KB43_9BACT|nr:hypothetical protein FAES_3338 [Fibrella aestuarina BUZ 2]
MWLRADIQRDHHIFGYEQPDTTSRKLLLLSLFTDSVQGNPHQCLYGAYYESASLNDLHLTFVRFTNAFAESRLLSGAKPIDTLYFRKEWVMWTP